MQSRLPLRALEKVAQLLRECGDDTIVPAHLDRDLYRRDPGRCDRLAGGCEWLCGWQVHADGQDGFPFTARLTLTHSLQYLTGRP